MPKRRVTNRVSLVKVKLNEYLSRSEKNSILRSVGSKSKTPAAKRKQFSRIARSFGGEYNRHTKAWKFPSDTGVIRKEKHGKQTKKEYSIQPFGMTTSLGKNKKIKYSFGNSGQYELLQINAELIIFDIDYVIEAFIKAINEGIKNGMEYFKVRIGHENAYWQRHAFSGEELIANVGTLFQAFNEYSGVLRKIEKLFLYGFKSEKALTKFTIKMRRVMATRKMLRRRKQRK